MAIIVIDPGHGGSANVGGSSWNNATGPAGTLEKTVTLAISQVLRDGLVRRGHTVTLTREDDRNLGLAERTAIARRKHADVFLSVHCNGWNTPNVQGTETWVHTRHGASSRALADELQRQLVAATGLADRGVKESNFGVLDPDRHDSHTAACLAEVSFLTDPAEERRLNDPDYRERLARHLADAIDTYVSTAHTGTDVRVETFVGGVPFEDATTAGLATPSEPELWQRQQAIAEAALGFAVSFLGCRMGPQNTQPLDEKAAARLRTIVRAVSFVESRHGTQGANQPARDPLQCGNPDDSWWRELTGQSGQGSRFVRGPGLKNLWANEVNAAAEDTAGFDAKAAFAVLANPKNGHRNRGFVPNHSYVWGIVYLLHHINTSAGDPAYACGDLGRERLILGAVSYNGGGVADYRERIERALKEIGDLPKVVRGVVQVDIGDLLERVAASAAALSTPAVIRRVDFAFDGEGKLSSTSFELSSARSVVKAVAHEVKVVRDGWDSGRLTFSSGGVNVDSVCWWDPDRKIAAGTYAHCSATRMATKTDSVTGEKRPGIYLPTAVAPDTGDHTIFIHEGKDPTWSDGCIVLPRDQMMRMWNVIEKDAQNVTVQVTDA